MLMLILLLLLLLGLVAGGMMFNRFGYAGWSPFGVVLLVLLFLAFRGDLQP